MSWQILNGDCREALASLPAGSVHTCVTSPPYFGLRDYGTAAWDGGDPACDHMKNLVPVGADDPGIRRSTLGGGKKTTTAQAGAASYRDICGKCGATRVDKQIGLEPTPHEFVAALVDVFREVRRVLRDDGTVWLNLGDSYNSIGGTVGGSKYAENGHQRERQSDRKRLAEGLKHKDLIGIPWMVAFALRADGWYLRSEIIWAKCLSGGTRLYAKTKKGEMPATLKDLVRLDPSTVKLWNGERWTQVLAWTPAERDVQFELELRNGERIGCTPEHRWLTSRGLLRTDQIRVGDVIDATRLPAPAQPREFMADGDLGYLVGLYLAEGSMSGDTVQIARHADQVEATRDRLLPLVSSMHGSAVAHRTRGKAATVNLNGPITAAAIRAYVIGVGAKGKHLSPRAWARSDEFLRAVVDGYLDGDGHWRGDAHRWVLGFTANDALAADLRTLCARLGYSVRLRRCVHRNQHGEFPGWRGSLVMEPERRRRPDTEIVAIRKSRARKFWDVTVEDEPHTFALASGTLTHNSNPMPESVTDRPTKAHEQVFLLSKRPTYYFDADAIREAPAQRTLDQIETDRRAGLYESDATGIGTGERNPQGVDADRSGRFRTMLNDAGRNKRSVWTVATQPYAGAHFATFPPKLIEPCILAGCPERCCSECGAPWERVVERSLENTEGWGAATKDHHVGVQGSDAITRNGAGRAGDSVIRTLGFEPSCTHNADPVPGMVLDPFAGAGTTGMVALRHGRSFVGCELNPEYAQLARLRIVDDAPLMNSVSEIAA